MQDLRSPIRPVASNIRVPYFTPFKGDFVDFVKIQVFCSRMHNVRDSVLCSCEISLKAKKEYSHSNIVSFHLIFESFGR